MREMRFAKLTAFDGRDSEFLRWGAAFCDRARRRLADDRDLQGSASSFSGGAMFLLRWAYEKPNCPLGRLWLSPQVLDTWHRDRRAVGPDRWLPAGLLRQRQPNGQVEAGSIKDLPWTEVGQARLPHR